MIVALHASVSELLSETRLHVIGTILSRGQGLMAPGPLSAVDLDEDICQLLMKLAQIHHRLLSIRLAWG